MLTKDNLGEFKSLLTAALRTTTGADEALSQRFVELRPGVISTLSAATNHLVTGRRGVGKSTTLAVLQRDAEERGDWVIFVDVETHKSRPYPDVLIEIILDVLKEVRPKVRAFKHMRLRRRINRAMDVLQYLRESAPVIELTTEENDTKTRDRGISLSGSVRKQFVKLSAAAGGTRSKRRSISSKSNEVRRKEDYLRDMAPGLSQVLESAADAHGSSSLLLVLDDFYFISKEMQPRVLDHLHGVTKRSKVWLKIGSVHSRTQSYQDGDPPLGMQPPNDLQHLSLDVGLDEFTTAQAFLENVADGVLRPAKLNIRTTLTATARERAVLIAGGAVSRDYFDLLIAAADAAWEAVQKEDATKLAEGFRIGAENIQAAAGRRLERKTTDLRNDAGRDAAVLEARFGDIVNFARNRDSYFILVRKESLDVDWGREIVQLEDLRFVHRITTTRPNTGSFRGVDTVVFMVDIPALVQQRMQKAPIEFWKPRQKDQLRRGSWVYTPDWEPDAPTKGSKHPPDEPGSEQLSLLDPTD